MKRHFLLATCLLLQIVISAQNIGIGTSSPSSKLTIQGAESTGNGLATGIQLTNTAPGGGSWYLRSGATGTATPAGGFSIGNSSDYVLSLNSSGNMGLLTVDPQERLHIYNGNIRLDNSWKGIQLNGIDRPFITRGFDPFTSGPYDGLGRWGLFMEPNRLTMGIPNLPGKAFQVARYELNGNATALFGVDANGALQLNGNTGTQGQVLTSNGTAGASWQKASSSSDNDVRFEASFIETGAGGLSNPTLNYSSYYNYNPTAVTITGSGITINVSGLYHIEGYYDAAYTFSGAPGLFAQELVSFLGRSFIESRNDEVVRDPVFTAQFRYINYGKFSREVYIIAPASISCGFSNSYSSGGVSFTGATHRGRISGYLISP